MRSLWLDPFSGISGDMLLGALLDLGAPLDGVRAALTATGLTGWPVPPMTVRAVGYGAGSRDVPQRPNVLPALLGTGPGAVSPMLLLETNVDDVTGEVLGHLIDRLLAAGAADAWVSPIVMKKSRPAHTVHVLAAMEHAADCERIVLRETGSLGLRRVPVERPELPRTPARWRWTATRSRSSTGRGVSSPSTTTSVPPPRPSTSPREVAERAHAAARRPQP